MRNSKSIWKARGQGAERTLTNEQILWTKFAGRMRLGASAGRTDKCTDQVTQEQDLVQRDSEQQKPTGLVERQTKEDERIGNSLYFSLRVIGFLPLV